MTGRTTTRTHEHPSIHPSGAGRRRGVAAIAAGLVLALAPAAGAQSLRGSRSSVERMYRFARGGGLEFRRTPDAIEQDLAAGRLVPLGPSLDYQLDDGVGWPYVTPETRRWVERFAEQYGAVCGSPLVITSASRPLSRQPRNANPKSVHPAGIAVDLRRPPRGPCLDWTRQALLTLERQGGIEAIEERRPVHFHIAVLAPAGREPRVPPLKVAGMDPLARRAGWLVERQRLADSAAAASAGATVIAAGSTPRPAAPVPAPARAIAEARPPFAPFDRRVVPAMMGPARPAHAVRALAALDAQPARVPGVVVMVADGDVEAGSDSAATAAPAPARTRSAREGRPGNATASLASRRGGRSYRVRPGDNLWTIARRHRTRVEAIVAANGLRRGAALRPGVVLTLP